MPVVVASRQLSANSGSSAATQRAAASRPAPGSPPCAAVSLVTSAKKRSSPSAAHEVAVGTEPLVERIQRLDVPVVGEHAPPARTGACSPKRSGRSSVADMREELRRASLGCLARELPVLVRGDGPLLHEHAPLPVDFERRQAVSIGVLVALLGERIGGVEQPERGRDRLASGGEAEQTAHGIKPCRKMPGGATGLNVLPSGTPSCSTPGRRSASGCPRPACRPSCCG